MVATSASLGADEGGSGGWAELKSSDHDGRPGLWTPRSRRNVRKAESPSYKLPASAKRPLSRHETSEDTASGTTMTVELKAMPASSSTREMSPQGKQDKQGKTNRPSAFGQMTQLHRAQSFKFDLAQQQEEEDADEKTTTTTTTRTVDAREHEKTNPLATRRSQRRIQPLSDLTARSRQESSRASIEDSPSLSPQSPPSAKASQRVAANEGVSDRVQSFEIGGAGQNATIAAASAVVVVDDDERVRKLLEQAGSELGSSQRFRNSISSPSPGAPGGVHHSFADGSSPAVAVEEDTAIADEAGEDGSGSDAWDGQL